MRRLHAIGWVAAIVMTMAAGCVASPPSDLEDRLWACTSADDCLEGWTCADRSVLGDDFCAPACDPLDPSTCAGGYCTAAGECLPGCTITADGVSAGCPPGRTCIRLDLFSDEGLCYPADGCTVSSDCGAGQACLNDVFSIPPSLYAPGFLDPEATFESDQVYCTAEPESGRCPVGYVLIASPGADSEPVCLPSCDAPARCPALFSCTRGVGALFGVANPDICIPGFWGLPCEDDTQCLLGQCLDTGDGRRACSETCARAEELSPLGCDLLNIGSALGVANFSFACENDTCVPYVMPGGICNEATRCLIGTCLAIPVGGDAVSLCIVPCTTDPDCARMELPPDRRDAFYCAMSGGTGVCLPKQAMGTTCTDDRQCASGRCMVRVGGRVCA